MSTETTTAKRLGQESTPEPTNPATHNTSKIKNGISSKSCLDVFEKLRNEYNQDYNYLIENNNELYNYSLAFIYDNIDFDQYFQFPGIRLRRERKNFDLANPIFVHFCAFIGLEAEYFQRFAQALPHVLDAIRRGINLAALLADSKATGEPKSPIPEKARITYAERSNDPDLANLDVIGFLRAEYGPWLDGALTRPDLRRMDKTAYDALTSWLQRHNNELPSDISLPSKSELVDREAEKITTAAAVPITSIRRLGQTIARRAQRSPS